MMNNCAPLTTRTAGARRSGLRTLLLLTIGTVMWASVAQAQATRTWVSGVGDDVNPCSRTAPCKTFAGAISKTAAGGEISVLDPGGFGPVTVTKSITLSGDGTLASILVTGQSAITINDSNAVPQSAVVTIRNLSLFGTALTSSGPGLVGINLVSGAALIVDRVTISGFQTGIATTMGNAAVINATITQNTDFGVHALSGVSSITVENSLLAGNGVAVQSEAGATIRLSNNGIYNNKTGFGCGNGTLASAGNNRKANNVGGTVAACAPNVAIVMQ